METDIIAQLEQIIEKNRVEMTNHINSAIQEIKRVKEKFPTNKNTPFSIQEVADMALLSRQIIEEDIKKGRLKTVTRGKRKFIPREEAHNYLKG